jgi:hypothetical protein
MIEIPDRHAAGIELDIDPDGTTTIGKAQLPFAIQALVAQENIVLVAIPGDIASKLVRVKKTLFVLLDVRDRAQDVGQS